MDLFDLDDLIPALGIDPSPEHLEELYQAFKVDFIDNDFFVDGIKVLIDVRNSKEEGFEAYPHTFVKIVTRGTKGHRNFDRKRANKIHWIKPILENRNTDDVTCFSYLESDGAIRDYFWFREGGFLVIMEKILPDMVIISCFHIDDDRNQLYYEKRYNDRII
ncbi:hypothetical protein [Flavobacterium piscis]|uniref:Phage-Barnase-EndoU-ColicinE5/D-RelE like nuclease 2 domain-containing protein n=1 Tax=Flavobacterium piscis TaxID=1114874 RepID=A0ABU1Y6Q0_9FLAO|nr:hypothetical protein [Flavobacterium piscis]MDR7209903.1 hypothetical protein [Flavobacterium piscis]